MGAVGEIEPEHIDARFVKAGKRMGCSARGTYGGDDFGQACAMHVVPPKAM
jgi:hypothetical protein